MKFRLGHIVIGLLAVTACDEGAVTAPEDTPALHRQGGGDTERIYEVTIENLTTSQPFSPGVIVTHFDAQRRRSGKKHGPKFQLFHPGGAASEGIRNIAENGSPSVAVSELFGAAGVSSVNATIVPVHRIGGPGATSLTVEITTDGRASRLSLAVMLICTNDGFVGVRNLRLPRGDHPITAYARAYDAGTEVNDELYESIVPPCGGIGPVAFDNANNARTVEGGKVRHHRGIRGGGDLDPAAHGWDGPVAKVTVRRIG